MKKASLLFLIKNDQILLAMKKRGFGVGKWNGVGGKPNEGEVISDTAIRECFEEIGVKPLDIKERATIDFNFADSKSDWNQQIIVFTCSSWDGEPVETEEMAPKWFKFNDIPFSDMWSDDKYWLPKVIAGKYVKANFHFDENEEVTKYNVEE